MALVAVVLFLIAPLFWMLLASFKTNVDIYDAGKSFLFTPTGENYANVLQRNNYFVFIFNSFWVAFVSTALSLVLGVPAAYAMSRFTMHRSALVVLMARVIPGVSLLVPWYYVFSNLKMVGGFEVLILSHMFVALPLIVYIMMSYFDSLPMELEESAQVDGLTPIGAFRHITLPLSVAGMATAGHPGLHLLVEQLHVRPGPVRLEDEDAARGHLRLRLLRQHRLGRADGGRHRGDHPDHDHCALHAEIHRVRPDRRRHQGLGDTAMTRISRIETFLVPPRWLFVRIETDSGIVGWGEASCEGRSETVRTAVDQLSELLIGQDALRIEDHWQVMTKGSFYRGGPILASAVSGLDQALWDIAGKHFNAPVHQLLGGPVRDRIRMYGWVGGDEPNEVADQISAQLEVGLTAVKMNASGRMSPVASVAELDGVVRRVAAAREVLGDHRDVAVDFHGRFSLANARRVAPLLEPYRPFFLEEPVVPENTHLLREFTSSTTTPVSTGERLYSRQEFLPALQAGIAVAQPDLSHAGGITETRKIASLAEIYEVQLAPHCPLGPLALAACLQVGFATPNFLIQEQSIGIHYNQGAEVLDYVVDKTPLKFVDGHIERLTGPGLGIEIDEAVVRAADKQGHAWRGPVWRHPDGSFAEW